GVKGELKIKATTAGRSVLKAGQLLRCTNGEESRELIVAAVREHGGRSLVRFDAINDATAAEALVGGELYATRDAFVLDSGEYLDEDLVGCRLFQEDGRDLGVVDAVEHYPQQDMLVVGKNRVPLVSAFIQDIDLSARQIRVTLPPGLLD
ncbi:MAG: 16S rRNA processing protein RimM, partial [Candidatus Eremiobacteraeota bacterium]|nr:16S rRNA processing protein RimM [Candidatus Eremiobacteraeota bacterium]